MQFTVWGGRGSHPTPLTPEAVQRKIATVVQRIQPYDLESPASRERFLASLPGWLFGTVGGNTSCIELELDESRRLIFDAGTGITEFSKNDFQRTSRAREYHLFFTHFHYDHVQGFPFVGQAYDPNNTFHFYSPLPDVREIISNQMRHPYFPVRMEERMTPHMYFHQIPPEGLDLFGAKIQWRELHHPGRAFGYRVDYEGRSFAFISDIEIGERDFVKTPENVRFFQGTDTMLLDAQYTLDEAVAKYNWGHSSFSLCVDFAIAWKAKRLYLYHHEPTSDDRKLENNLDVARSYAKGIDNGMLKVELAREGLSVNV